MTDHTPNLPPGTTLSCPDCSPANQQRQLRGKYHETAATGKKLGGIRGEDMNTSWLDTMGDFAALHPVVRLAAPKPEGGAS